MSLKRKLAELGPDQDAPGESGGSIVPSGSLREIERKRRQVFKPVLDNPYTQTTQWPFIEPELAENVIGLLQVALQALASYNEARERQIGQEKAQERPDKPKLTSPVGDHVTIGFNSTVKSLESQAKKFRRFDQSTSRGKPLQETAAGENTPYLKYVFVCKYDITPAILTSHFPILTFTASRSLADRVKLVQLPRGSMERLSRALHVKSAGIIGISAEFALAQVLRDLVNTQVADVQAPWLEGLLSGEWGPFYKPNLAFLATTAPIMAKKNGKQGEKKRESKNGINGAQKSDVKPHKAKQ